MIDLAKVSFVGIQAASFRWLILGDRSADVSAD
jgi:hypothetical protein